MTLTVDQLVEISEAIELRDPIDQGMLSINDHDAYLFLATGDLENYNATDRELIMPATMVKLTVKNFVLNLRLLDMLSKS